MSGVPFILVCDDTKNIAMSLVFILQSAGYRSQAVSTAMDCVSVARRERPNLIIMDIMMPGMDGAMASELMKESPELATIPVILLSAMPEDEVQEKAQSSGAAGYLLKPFKKDTILQLIRKFVPAAPPAKA